MKHYKRKRKRIFVIYLKAEMEKRCASFIHVPLMITISGWWKGNYSFGWMVTKRLWEVFSELQQANEEIREIDKFQFWGLKGYIYLFWEDDIVRDDE